MKELAGYLFHGLKFVDSEGDMYEVDSMSSHGISLWHESLGPSECKPFNVWVNELGYKPILRPLDLTSEITHKGKVFVPCEVLLGCDAKEEKAFEVYGTIPEYWKDFAKWVKKKSADYKHILLLQEWMFDIHGLIDQGKAISVHDLEVNPYE